MQIASQRWAWLLLVGLALSALALSTTLEGPPRTNQDRIRSLSEDFACPTCDGQSVAESNAVVAVEIKREIGRQVDNGATDEEITELLISSYDESIDLRPRSSGLVGLVWVLPIVATVFAFAGLAQVFRRWRNEAALEATDADAAIVDELLRERSDP